ncbi:MAG: hypothetical protein C4331_11650 [Meiothermus sp.]
MRLALLITALLVLVACGGQPNATPPQTSGFTLEQIAQLTPEQIQNLNEAQLEGINRVLEPEFARVDAELAQVQTELGLSQQGDLEAQDARWPNFGYTVYVATSISYKTFFSSYYRKYSGPNWNNDGCSNSPDYPLGLNFKPSCNHHDFGYRNVSQYARGRNETYRKYVDNRLLSNLRSVCSDLHWWDPRRLDCYALAYTYYTAVRNFGKSSYYGNPQRYP